MVHFAVAVALAVVLGIVGGTNGASIRGEISAALASEQVQTSAEFPDLMYIEGWKGQDDFFGACHLLGWGTENNINIGSISAGGGAGKATFKEMSIRRPVDSMSAAFLSALAMGAHIPEMKILIGVRRDMKLDIRNPEAGVSTIIDMKLVMVQDYSILTSDGGASEHMVFQFGAYKFTHRSIDPKTSKLGEPTSSEWSRVKNKASFTVV